MRKASTTKNRPLLNMRRVASSTMSTMAMPRVISQGESSVMKGKRSSVTQS